MIKLSKIKIEIISKNIVPININNPILNYKQDKNRQSNRLLVKVYYGDIKIGMGIILDFYKQFEIIEDFGEPQTRVYLLNTKEIQNLKIPILEILYIKLKILKIQK